MSTDSITLWKQRIENRKASGLKVNEWCEQNHISRHAYYYWHRKITDMKSEQESIPIFAEVLAGAKEQRASSDIPVINATWKDISITVTDKDSAELAAYFLYCLRGQC